MAGRVRILVTGSRGWRDRQRIYDILNGYADEFGAVTVVHGANGSGADAMAAGWVRDHGQPLLIAAEPHPAAWDKCAPDCRHYVRRPGFCQAAGFRRNAEMVALGADVCLAFTKPCEKKDCRIAGPHDSHGTSHCADLAEKAGIPVRRFYQAGVTAGRG